MPKIIFYSWTYTAVLISQNHQIIFKNKFNAFAFGSQNNVPPGASGGSDSKESACNAGDPDFILELGRSPGEGNGNPLQCSCLEKPHGQKSLEGYSSWSCKELNTTQQLTHTHTHTHTRYKYTAFIIPFHFFHGLCSELWIILFISFKFYFKFV